MASFVYDSAKEAIVDGSIALETHSFKIALLAATYTPSQSHAALSDVSAHEIDGSGYTAGGFALSGVALSRAGATVKFDANDVAVQALSPDFRYAVIYDDTHASDALLALLDPGSLQEPDGNNVNLIFNANGIFTLTDPA